VLFFPGSRPELFAKAAATGAERVCLDLEDAVPAAEKDAARSAASRILTEGGEGVARLVVRVNHPSTQDGGADLTALAGVATDTGASLRLLIPKVSGPADLGAVREALGRCVDRTELVAMIETVRGLSDAERIAASPGVSALLFGGFDLSLELGASPGWESLLYARSRVVVAARLGGVAAIDMPFLGVGNPDGLASEAGRARRLGFDGKAAIHPEQVATIADAFGHTPAEVRRARRIEEESRDRGAGAFLLDGEMVDRPILEAARRIVAWADARGC